ncbi:snapalysin family zinc-dependent metalloprotease [Micromonospora sp. NPDC000089]|uniref:snapalysin family zinc-dependent metalloprotease n=1 Tax=unclassified Micromonospora TaxID=2617518 RepID=UPI0036C1C71C
MSVPRTARWLTAAAVGVAAVVVPQLPASAAAATVCYDTSQAGAYAGTTDSAASIWNGATNVTLAQCGSSLRVHQITGGGSYAVRTSLGVGDVYIDTEQAAQYSPLRIVTHEIGHILGLPDNYNGDCSLLMSGGSAGTACTNPYPSAGEAAQVDAYFGTGLTARSADGGQVFRDSWPAPAAVTG